MSLPAGTRHYCPLTCQVSILILAHLPPIPLPPSFTPLCGPNIPRAPSQPFLNAPSMPSSLPPSPIHILTSYPLTCPFLMSAIPHSFIPFLAFHDTPKFIPHRKTSSRPSHIPFYLLLNSHLHTSAIYPHLVFSMKLAICHPTSP